MNLLTPHFIKGKRMPRPKPPSPLKGRNMRMSDVEWLMFKELGGADWLRQFVKKKAKLPINHYEKQVEDERMQKRVL
jgi:hypothetical protein